MTAEDGNRALELVLEIYKSVNLRMFIHLPLDECATMDFHNRFMSKS